MSNFRELNTAYLKNRNELDKIFNIVNGLPKDLTLKKRRSIMRSGLRPFVKDAKATFPTDTGQAAQSIGYKVFKDNPNRLFAGVVLGKRISATIGGQKFKAKLDAFYSQWIEYGFTQIAWPKKGAKWTSGQYHPNRLKAVGGQGTLRKSWKRTSSICLQKTQKAADRVVSKWLKSVDR